MASGDLHPPSRPDHIVWTAQFVRRRPDMYLGNTGSPGVHAMLFGLVSNAVAETAAGRARSAGVALGPGGLVEVTDDGRGVPPDWFVFTEEAFRSRETGRRWLDYAVANALSERMSIRTAYRGRAFRQEFRRGDALGPPRDTGPAAGGGVAVEFRPDPEVFGDALPDPVHVRDRLSEHAYLNSGTRFTFSTASAEEHFEFDDGIRAFVGQLCGGEPRLHDDVIVARGGEGGVRFEAGLLWCAGGARSLRPYVNDDLMVFGGTHVTGLRSAVTRSLNRFAHASGPAARRLGGSDATAGLTAVVSVRMPNPRYDGATRMRLGSPEVRGIVESGVGRVLREFFRSHPDVVGRIVRDAITGER